MNFLFISFVWLHIKEREKNISGIQLQQWIGHIIPFYMMINIFWVPGKNQGNQLYCIYVFNEIPSSDFENKIISQTNFL